VLLNVHEEEADMRRPLTAKARKGLEKLNSVLPLKSRQESLDEKGLMFHRTFLKTLAEKGRAMTRPEMRDFLGVSDQEIEAIVARLSELDLLVVSCCGGPVGSYPLTTEPTPHKVTSNGVRINAMCALDALAVGPMYARDVIIDSICHVSGEPIHIEQSGYRITKAVPSRDIHFGIVWGSPTGGCCAKSLCTEMVFIKDKETAERWRHHEGSLREIYDLEESVDFAAAFFVPLTED
jgi:alkylmercury lyase